MPYTSLRFPGVRNYPHFWGWIINSDLSILEGLNAKHFMMKKKLNLSELAVNSFITDRHNIRGGIFTHSSDTGPIDCATPHGPCTLSGEQIDG